MKLKNNSVGFNVVVDKNLYKIPKGYFKLLDEVGCLLLTMSCFDIVISEKLTISEDLKNKIINKYTKNGEIKAVELKSNFAMLLLMPLSDILKRKKTYLIETKIDNFDKIKLSMLGL